MRVLLLVLFPLIGLSNSIVRDCDIFFANGMGAFNDANYTEALIHFNKASSCYMEEKDFDSASIASLYILETLFEQKNYAQLKLEIKSVNQFLQNLKLPIFEKTQNDHSIQLFQAKLAAGNGRMEKAKSALERLQKEFGIIIDEREHNNMTPKDSLWVNYAKKRLIYFNKAIAIIFIDQKAYQTALDYFNQAYAFIKLYPAAITTGSKNSYLTTISNIYLELNDFKNAKAKLLEAITLLNEVKEKKKYEKQAYYQLSEISKKEGKLDSAKYYLQLIKSSYGEDDEDYWKTCYRLAEINFLNNAYDTAATWINCAISNLKNNSVSNLAKAHLLSARIKVEQNLMFEAEQNLNLALNKFYNGTISKDTLIYSITLSEILNLKVNLQLLKDNLDRVELAQCKKDIKQALCILEKFRTNDLYQGEKQDLVNFYYDYFETAMEVAYLDYESEPSHEKLIETLQISEQGKAITLMESIHDMLAKKKAKVSADLLRKETQYKEELSDVEDQLSNDPSNNSLISKRVAIKEKINLLIKEISAEFPEYNLLLNSLSQNNSKVKESLLSQIDNHDLILEYFYTPDNIYLISIENQKLSLHLIKNSTTLENKILAFRKSIVEKDKTIYKKLGAELYQQLFQAVLKNQEDILIIPDGPLSLIPFESLLKEDASDTYLYSDLPYVIKDHTITYSYSLVLQNRLNAIRVNKSKQKFLGVSPDFSKDHNLKDLLYNIKEVESINSLIGQKNKTPIDLDKSEFISIANNFRIIHLATHANADVEDLSNSSIAFYKDSLSFLYIKDIYSHSISPEMLVLSACQTGNGNIIKGEGIMSLSRAFLQSGTKSVINSQWNLNDQSGQEIMLDFYKNLKAGHQKNTALKMAKLKYLDTPRNDAFNAPRYWASLNVIGDVSPVKLNNSIFFLFLFPSLGISLLLLIWKYFFLIRKEKQTLQ